VTTAVIGKNNRKIQTHKNRDIPSIGHPHTDDRQKAPLKTMKSNTYYLSLRLHSISETLNIVPAKRLQSSLFRCSLR